MSTKKTAQTEDKKNNGHEDVNVAEKDASKKEKKKEKKEPTLEEQLAEVKEELASAKDQNLRLYAEFENFKRRNAKERLELMSTANMEVMQTLLPIIDDFERAIKNTEKTKENAAVAEGVELIYNKLIESLKQKGLKQMESTIGKDFDVEVMDAITQLPVPDKKQDGKVMDEIEKGYYLGDKILRHARVVVAVKQG
jgi:molecular chaperone GrpE